MSRLIVRYRCSHLKITNSQPSLSRRRSLWTKLTSTKSTASPGSVAGDRGFLVDRDCDVCIASQWELEHGTVYKRERDEGDSRALSGEGEQGGERGGAGKEGKSRNLEECDLGLQRLSHNDDIEFGLVLASAVEDISKSSELLEHDTSSHPNQSSPVEIIPKPQLWQLNLSPSPSIPPCTPSPTVWNFPSPPPHKEALPTTFPPSATLWKSPRGLLWYPRYQAPRPPSPVVWNYPPSRDIIKIEYPEGIYFPPPPLTALWSPLEEELSTWSSSSSSSSEYEYSGSDATSDEDHDGGRDKEEKGEEEGSSDLDHYRYLQNTSFEREEFERKKETSKSRPRPAKLTRHRIWALLDEEGYDYAAEALSVRLQSYYSKAALIRRHFIGSTFAMSTPILTYSSSSPLTAANNNNNNDNNESNSQLIAYHSPAPTPTATSSHPTLSSAARYRVTIPSPLRQELRVFRRQPWDADGVVPADRVGRGWRGAGEGF